MATAGHSHSGFRLDGSGWAGKGSASWVSSRVSHRCADPVAGVGVRSSGSGLEVLIVADWAGISDLVRETPVSIPRARSPA